MNQNIIGAIGKIESIVNKINADYHREHTYSANKPRLSCMEE